MSDEDDVLKLATAEFGAWRRAHPGCRMVPERLRQQAVRCLSVYSAVTVRTALGISKTALTSWRQRLASAVSAETTMSWATLPDTTLEQVSLTLGDVHVTLQGYSAASVAQLLRGLVPQGCS